jgi:hypothetical protein
MLQFFYTFFNSFLRNSPVVATQHNGLKQQKSTKKADLEKKPLLLEENIKAGA